MRVEVIRAWADRCQSIAVELPDGATVAQALQAVDGRMAHDDIAALAVFGIAVSPMTPLRDGDRLEMLRPLLADPKDARRIRARRALDTRR